MSLPFEIEQKLDAIKKQIGAMGVELVEVSFGRSAGRNILRFIVDKAGGVTLEDCAEVNRRLGDFFDEAASNPLAKDEFIKGSYILEVNSPGLDRPLKTERDFLRALGETLRVIYREEGSHVKTILGTLEAAREGVLELKLKDGSLQNLILGNVVKASREIKFNRDS